ncbi:TonB family protein [Cyclobacterium jeungdonense]|uniref:TonB family protein n=1 Tax=Cyclobacterium jeungdonense TaxID=708087 RepID=A0ABT8C0E8_9BACT|nr:TonB family protein [Cyclobacterium jeungdonense]MDN3686269.1 TonB family protein [Cyclobacterium jeungdonense]
MMEIILKVIACSAILMLLFHVFLAKEKTFRLNRWILLFLIPAAMVIPFLSFPVFFPQESPVQIAFFTDDLPQTSVISQPNPSPEVTSPLHWFLTGYVSVCFILLFLKLKAMHRLTEMTKNSDALSLPGALLILTEKAASPFSFGKYIFMHPRTYREGSENTEMIIRHESVHVAQYHHLDLIWIEFLLVICWFNPVVYLVKRAMVLNHEYLADQEVQQVVHPIKYKKLLLELSERNNPAIWTSFLSSSPLRNRLIMMNKPVIINRILSRVLSFSLFTTLIIAGFSLEINARQTPSTGQKQDQYQWDQTPPPIEQQPAFKGGMEAFYNYVENELRYPLEARQKGIEGQVEIQFVVEKDGSLSNVFAIHGIGAGCDAEAVRVIKNSPAFDPGKQRGSPVRVRMVLPIRFSLNKPDSDKLPSGIFSVGEVDQRNGALKVDAEYADGLWSGSVRDPEGNGLPGANIVVMDTNRGSVTDINGKFSIKTSPSERIVISFVGYESVSLKGN